MNKQQLAAKIWESANKMRSKIEANEYKDYILGFIFYKFLSETEIARLRAEDWGDEDLKGLDENDAETVQYIRDLYLLRQPVLHMDCQPKRFHHRRRT